jgi:ADP-ribose pyrophosphatase
VSDAHLRELGLGGQVLAKGNFLEVRRDDVRLPDGNTATREYVVHPGAVLIVPVLPDGRLVVERQFRYPVGKVFLEFPAGKLDPGEAELVTAQRELAEEAGYVAATWTPLGRVHSVVGYSNEAIDFFIAEGLTQVGAALDDGEFLEIVILTLDEMLAALDRGEITDAKTVAALLLFARRRSR